MNNSDEWVRARGLGRERLAGYLADYLSELGYLVQREELGTPATSMVSAELKRLNPAVPKALAAIRLRFMPTSGGAAGQWESPTSIPVEERPGVDRFLRELLLHLERTVRTESHGTAKLQVVAGGRLPWENGGAETGSTPSPPAPL